MPYVFQYTSKHTQWGKKTNRKNKYNKPRILTSVTVYAVVQTIPNSSDKFCPGQSYLAFRITCLTHYLRSSRLILTQFCTTQEKFILKSYDYGVGLTII